MAAARWHVLLSCFAEDDFEAILDWTAKAFGPKQVEVYRAAVVAALRHLEAGPSVLGVVNRDDIGPGRRTLHLNRAGGRGRHLILFESLEPGSIHVLRILHDAMDPPRHIPPTGLQEDAPAFVP